MNDDSMSASATATTSHIQARRDLVFLVLAGLFLGTLGDAGAFQGSFNEHPWPNAVSCSRADRVLPHRGCRGCASLSRDLLPELL